MGGAIRANWHHITVSHRKKLKGGANLRRPWCRPSRVPEGEASTLGETLTIQYYVDVGKCSE